jgi:archaellum component FlaF (FlaF/FlaG flagellin family)
MGFSVTLTHIMMVIASIILASIFTACAFYAGSVVQNQLTQGVSNVKNTVNIQVDIVYATVNTTSPPNFVIYAKNTGNLPISDYSYLDVYVGTYGNAQLYTYNPTASPGSGNFSITVANGNGVWEPLETATIYVYPTGEISGTLFEAKIVPSQGIGSDYLFSAPTF